MIEVVFKTAPPIHVKFLSGLPGAAGPAGADGVAGPAGAAGAAGATGPAGAAGAAGADGTGTVSATVVFIDLEGAALNMPSSAGVTTPIDASGGGVNFVTDFNPVSYRMSFYHSGGGAAAGCEVGFEYSTDGTTWADGFLTPIDVGDLGAKTYSGVLALPGAGPWYFRAAYSNDQAVSGGDETFSVVLWTLTLTADGVGGGGGGGGGDALKADTLDQFADVTQTAGQTLAITSSTTLSGGTHSGTNTGDETAAGILAKLLTVDGPGSLLDADTLDGSSSAAFGLVANPLSQFASTTSLQLAGVISDETGSGALVFGTSPTLVTPVLGAASATSLTLTNDLAVADGGTGASTFTDGGVLIGNSTGAIQATSAGTAGQVLTSNGAGVDPTFQAAGGISDGDKGDITVSASGATWTIDAGVVTLAKQANLAQDQFIGRTTASTGVPETATITAAARTVLDDVTVAAMVDTLGGATSTGTGGIARATSPGFTTAINPLTNDAAALGTTALGWSDLFLASGGTVHFANTDWVATHTTGILTVGTGDLRVTTAGTNAESVVTVGGTQTLTGKTIAASSISAGILGGNITLGESTGQIILDPALSADGTWSGICEAGTAGATLAFGDLVYLQTSDSRWELADADADATSGAVKLGICVLAAASDGSATTILLIGKIRADAAFPTMTIGVPVYVSTTAGDIQVAQPSGTDDVIRVVGYANTADELYFNPAGTYITRV